MYIAIGIYIYIEIQVGSYLNNDNLIDYRSSVDTSFSVRIVAKMSCRSDACLKFNSLNNSKLKVWCPFSYFMNTCTPKKQKLYLHVAINWHKNLERGKIKIDIYRWLTRLTNHQLYINHLSE